LWLFLKEICGRVGGAKTHFAPAPATIPLETKMLEFSKDSSPNTKTFAFVPQPAMIARAFVCV
jgi:hypothetical protein